MEDLKRMKFTMGERLKLLRDKHWKSEDDVSRHLNISFPTYLKMEEDFLYPSDYQLIALGTLYGMTYDEVINFGE